MTQLVEEATSSIEREKLDLENRKLDVELRKARWTAVSISVPVVVAMLTIGFGFWSARQQSRQQFQLTALQLVMNTASPNEALGRAKFLMQMFPGAFPVNLDLDEKEFSGPSVPLRQFFLQLVSQSNLPRRQLLELWQALFPGDTWAKSPALERALAGPSPSDSGQPVPN